MLHLFELHIMKAIQKKSSYKGVTYLRYMLKTIVKLVDEKPVNFMEQSP